MDEDSQGCLHAPVHACTHTYIHALNIRANKEHTHLPETPLGAYTHCPPPPGPAREARGGRRSRRMDWFGCIYVYEDELVVSSGLGGGKEKEKTFFLFACLPAGPSTDIKIHTYLNRTE